MKTLHHGLLLIIFLSSIPVFGQEVNIKQRSIEKKTKFNTVITLMDGNKIRGKLTACSDSAITISISKKYDYGIFYYDESSYFYDIQNIRIARKMSARGFIAGAVIGLAIGTFVGFVGMLVENYSYPYVDTGYENAFWIGPLAGATLFLTIEILAKRKYNFPIECNFDSFSFYRNDIKLMVIDKQNLISH